MTGLNPAVIQNLENTASNLLSNHYLFKKDDEDAYLRARFEKKVYIPRNISFGVTTEEDLKKQYYKIREAAYRQLLDDDKFTAPEDEFDKNGHIFVAKSANVCVGGLRITVSKPGSENRLPLETEDFRIKDFFPWLTFMGVTYSEPSKLALLPDYRDGQVLENLFFESIKYYTQQLGVEIAFGRSAILQTRRFKQYINSAGFNFISRYDINLPHHDYYAHLWAVDFTPDRRYSGLLAGEDSGKNVVVSDQELEIA